MRTATAQAWVNLADSRTMAETPSETIALGVTSPPYWHIKDYGVPHQIGYGQSLHEYLYDLSRVWKECWRVLKPGRRLCINVGDQFARATVYGQYKVIPLHAEIIAQCETIGFDYLGAIIWQKKTTMRPSGGAVVMGSFPYPPNGIVELDYEYILLFRKPGKVELLDSAAREASALSRDEWKTYFSGHWHFAGERQALHEAMFPEELPRRLIRMFSLLGETVLDPFAGSGTTLKVALDLGRSAVGYEIQPNYIPLIREKLGVNSLIAPDVQIRTRATALPPVEPPEGYQPRIKDAKTPDRVAPSAGGTRGDSQSRCAAQQRQSYPRAADRQWVDGFALGNRSPSPSPRASMGLLESLCGWQARSSPLRPLAWGKRNAHTSISLPNQPIVCEPQNDRDGTCASR
jgi:DNA modification methylase